MAARGFLLGLSAVCAAIVCCADLAAQEVSLDLEDAGEGRYRIEGRFQADISSRTAWEVLTDYNGIADFVSSLYSSKVMGRRPDHIVLEQVAVGRVLLVSRKVRVLLEVHEAPLQIIAFEDIAGEDFEYYAGSWRIGRNEDLSGVTVTYRLEAKHRFIAPDFIARGIMKKNAQSLLAEVRKEMLRRAALTISNYGGKS